MKLFKIAALMTAAAMVVTLTGCKHDASDSSSQEQTAVATETERDYLKLLYSSSDTLNPYTAKTEINRQLCKLIYEPLIKLDNEFNVNFSIAESAEMDKNKCTVSLKNAVFSDGSAVTANDVVKSYHLAKGSTTAYASKLYEVTSVSASGSKTVVFTLNKADPYFVNVLDFPIIKSGSDSITNSDGVTLPPVGCGRFKIDDDGKKLVRNEKFFEKAGAIKEIELINAPDEESTAHYVEIGAADMFYSDISDGKILRMSGKKVNINLNNLVYIGVNKDYGDLGQNLIRQAISSGINRQNICRDAYYNNAVSATGFFHSSWKTVKSVQNIQTASNEQITIENLEKIGYNSLDSNGCRINSARSALKFTLLVNSDNTTRVAAARLIANQLNQYGFKITVVEKPYDAYAASLAAGDFQLYLAEVKITDNMDISNLVLPGGSVAYGIKEDNPTVSNTTSSVSSDDSEDSETSDGSSATEPEETPVPLSEIMAGYYGGANTIGDIASVLQTEMPVIPVCFRTGVLFYNDNIENVKNSSESDIYFSIESYTIKKKTAE